MSEADGDVATDGDGDTVGVATGAGDWVGVGIVAAGVAAGVAGVMSDGDGVGA